MCSGVPTADAIQLESDTYGFLNIPAANVMSVAKTQSAHQQRNAKEVQQILMDLLVS